MSDPTPAGPTAEPTVTCSRCGRAMPRLAKAPLPGPLGREVQERACGECWREWQKAEVMVINELRLNFMDPQAQEILNGHLRQFLLLDG